MKPGDGALEPFSDLVLGVAVRPSGAHEALEGLRQLRQELPGVTLRYPPEAGRAMLAAATGDRAEPADELRSTGWVRGCGFLLLPAPSSAWAEVVRLAFEAGLPVLAAEAPEAACLLGMGGAMVGGFGWDPLIAGVRRIWQDPAEREALSRKGRAQARRYQAVPPLLSPGVATQPGAGTPSLALEVAAPSRALRKLADPAASRVEEPRIAHSSQLTDRRYRKLSIILALHGRRELTQACLETLRADRDEEATGVEWEIVCVDNASPDDTRSWLARQNDVTILPFEQNLGCPAGWNAGLRVATGDVLCVLNNDTLIHPGGMRHLARTAAEHSIAALQGGMLTPEFRFAGYTDDPALSDYPDGCALAFRRDVWEHVGEFDEGMGLGYCEDTDWGLRARSLGYRWEFCPGALTHLGQQTSQHVPEAQRGESRNQERLARRWTGFGVGHRIVVRRWGALGDVVMSTPVLSALRREYPLGRIHLQCAPEITATLQGLPHVDRVSAEVPAHADRWIDLDDAYERLERNREYLHPALAYGAAAGVPLADLRYSVPEVPELDAWAATILPEGHYVACGLRSAERAKVNWSERAWRELAAAAPELRFVAFDGHPRPRLDAHPPAVRGGLWEQPNVIDLTGHTPTPRHLLALLRRCSAAVSVDTGLWHLAAAVGLPTVGLVGAGPGWARAPLFGRHRVFQGEAPCYPCANVSRCSREDGPHCLATVSAIEVAVALRKLLSVGSAEPVGAVPDEREKPLPPLPDASRAKEPAELQRSLDCVIVTSWYLHHPDQLWLPRLWRKVLHRLAPGVPLLLIDNASPVPPPFDDCERVAAPPGLQPHCHGSYGHLFNCWHAMCAGFRLLAERGVKCGIYLEQDVVPGITFATECIAALGKADLLFNTGCMHPGWAYTEYLAASPSACARLWERPFPAGPFDPGRGPFSEEFLPRWAEELSLRTAPFPGFRHERDGPLHPDDTYTHHLPRADVERFVRERGLL